MSVSNADQERIREKLPAKQDCAVTCSVLEAIRQIGEHGAVANFKYGIDEGYDEHHFVLYLNDGVELFSDEHAIRLFNLSVRIVDIRFIFSKRRIALKIVRHASNNRNLPREPYVPIERRKKQHCTIDFDAPGIGDADDRRTICGIIDEVYHIAEVMKTTVWFESIVDEFERLLKPRRVRLALASEEASETEVSLEGERIGYAICFRDMPEFSCTFMQHLKSRYGTLVTTSYVWFEPNEAPTFVVNVRRTNVSMAKTHSTIKGHVPLGLKRRKTSV